MVLRGYSLPDLSEIPLAYLLLAKRGILNP